MRGTMQCATLLLELLHNLKHIVFNGTIYTLEYADLLQYPELCSKNRIYVCNF